MENKFEIAGIRRTAQEETLPRRKKDRDRPFLSMVVLAVIVCGCLACELIMTKDPTYLDLQNYNIMPGREFLFGTDTMGRDIFSMIWYGGRISPDRGSVGAPLHCRGHCLRSGQRLRSRMAGCADDAPGGNTAQCAGAFVRGHAAGGTGRGECAEYLLCDRDHELDEYGEDRQKRGAAAQKQ